MGRHKAVYAAAILFTVVVLGGCLAGEGKSETEIGHEQAEQKQAAENAGTNSKVKLKAAITLGWLGRGELDRYLIDPVLENHPEIELEIVDTGQTTLNNLVITGQIPDLVMTANPLIHRYTTLGLQENMEPLIKKMNFDLSKLNQAAVESVKSASGFKELIGIPWTMHFHPLYYNKDIFDQFGVDYPTDGMTWEETIEVARKVTRVENGVTYRGLEPDYSFRVASSLGLGMVDPAEKKALVDSEGWVKVFEMLYQAYSIPNNGNYRLGAAGENQFIRDRTLAMLPGLNRLPLLIKAEGLNWDMVQYPQFPEAPNTSMGVDEWIFHVTKQSKHKEEVMKVIMTVLSEEVQTDMARNARFPILTNKEIEEQFGKAVPQLEGKNLSAAFLSQPAEAYAVSQWDELAQKVMGGETIGPIISGEKDINTALREAAERINQEISESN